MRTELGVQGPGGCIHEQEAEIIEGKQVEVLEPSQ